MKPLLFATVLLGCAQAPPSEKIMKLDLETRVAKKGDQIVVTGTLRNTGTEPVKVLLESLLYESFAVLRDAEGKEIPPSHNDAAVRGVPFFKKPLKVLVLKPGQAVEVGSLTLLHSFRTVRSGDLSWDSDVLRSDTLTAELVYEVSEGHAENARRLDEPDIAIGRWTAKPVTLTFKK
jgi:hypothetical protein